MENTLNTLNVERAIVKITQAELASKVNCSRQTIHALESGKLKGSESLKNRIAKFFGKQPEEIFNPNQEQHFELLKD